MSVGPTTTQITAMAIVQYLGDVYAIRHAHCPACGRPVIAAERLDRNELKMFGLSYWSKLVLAAGNDETAHPTVHLCPPPARL